MFKKKKKKKKPLSSMSDFNTLENSEIKQVGRNYLQKKKKREKKPRHSWWKALILVGTIVHLKKKTESKKTRNGKSPIL